MNGNTDDIWELAKEHARKDYFNSLPDCADDFKGHNPYDEGSDETAAITRPPMESAP
jgi:hypothetical protein